MEPVNVDAMLARFAEHWSPKRIAQVNNYETALLLFESRDAVNTSDVSGELTAEVETLA